MEHYPVRGVVDATFSVVLDGVQHSIFASGIMPLDRSTIVGPIRVEVLEPIRRIRYLVEPNEHQIECDLTCEASTVAVEEPRQRQMSPEGIVTMDHTRLTQRGAWTGSISSTARTFGSSRARCLIPGTAPGAYGPRVNRSR
jgi:hypothetical protein